LSALRHRLARLRLGARGYLTTPPICPRVSRLRGLKAIHSCAVLHRDLKPSNLLVNKNCDLKICDFGLARGIDESHSPLRSPTATSTYKPLTEYVVTRWYRAPELLCANKRYGAAIDMWSVGCILAECLSRRVLFKGKDQLDQLRLVISVLGLPSAFELRAIENDAARHFASSQPVAAGASATLSPLATCVPAANAVAVDLLGSLLAFDATRRPTAAQALAHAYLQDLHGLNDEPDALAFEHGFEAEGVTELELRQLIWREMASFHPEIWSNQRRGKETLPLTPHDSSAAANRLHDADGRRGMSPLCQVSA